MPPRQRMTVPRLGESTDQHVVAGFEEDDPRLDVTTLERAAHRGQCEWGVARPDVQDDRHLVESLPIRRHELGQVRQQLTGQVVHARVAEVFEELGGGGLARAGEPAQDYDALLALPPGRRRLAGRGGARAGGFASP